MDNKVLEDLVEIQMGSIETVGICPACGETHKIKAAQFQQNKNGGFEHHEYYELNCIGCQKTIPLCAEVHHISDHDEKIFNAVIANTSWKLVFQD